VFNVLFDELDKVGGTVLIVLDEIDNIGDDDDLLYELPRAEANGYVDNVARCHRHLQRFHVPGSAVAEGEVDIV